MGTLGDQIRISGRGITWKHVLKKKWARITEKHFLHKKLCSTETEGIKAICCYHGTDKSNSNSKN